MTAAVNIPEPVDVPAGSVLLRPWLEDDLDDAWAALQDADIRLWNGQGSESREDALQLIRGRQDWSSGTHASWAIADPDTRAFIGSVSLFKIDLEQGDAEIGYWVAPPARGRNAAAQAVDAVCRWAFATIGLDRIVLFHAVDNPASARVAEKAGFTYEGHLRRSYRYADGIRHDELVWSRLSDD